MATFDPTPFLSLMRDRAELNLVVSSVLSAVTQSFKGDGARGSVIMLTQDEVKRRTEILAKWFKIMRGDLGWSIDRTLDFLPTALRQELDGVVWEPPSKDRAWSPTVMEGNRERVS